VRRRRLVLYRRPGCHLCDEARELVRPLVAEAGDVELREVDIESDDALLARFLERIPVLELDGRVLSELVPDASEVSAALLQTSAR
jgi:glutaredoxin